MSEISIKALKDLSKQALLKTGLSTKHVDITVDHYVENELSGKASHGIVRVIEAVKTIEKYGVPSDEISIVLDKGNITVMEAKGQLGTVAALKASELVIKRAQEHGLAFIGTRNYIASTGSMAYYLRRFTAKGLIAIMGCNSVALVSHPNSKERIVGTNPIGVGFPSADGQDFITDIATSAIAYGKIMVAKDTSEALPEGVLIDNEGNPSTNPEDAYNGAILPLAEYKGFGLATMIMLLSGALIGAKDIKKEIYDSDGFFMIALDPKHFGHSHYGELIQQTLKDIKQTALAPNADKITMPGERSARKLAKSLEDGYINIADKTLTQLQEMA